LRLAAGTGPDPVVVDCGAISFENARPRSRGAARRW
jgi:hypothetical protein